MTLFVESSSKLQWELEDFMTLHRQTSGQFFTLTLSGMGQGVAHFNFKEWQIMLWLKTVQKCNENAAKEIEKQISGAEVHTPKLV